MNSKSIQSLRHDFIGQYPDMLKMLIEQWTQIRCYVKNKAAVNDIKAFYIALLNLDSTSSTLGFHDLTVILKKIEHATRQLQQQKNGSDHARDIDFLMNQLITCANEVQDPLLNCKPISALDDMYQQNIDAKLPKGKRTLSVGVIQADAQHAKNTANLLESFYLDALPYTSVGQFLKSYQNDYPELILIDCGMPQSSPDEIITFTQLMQEYGCKVMFLSSQDDLDTRLAAVRAGVVDFFLMPINISYLISRIRKTFDLDTIEPMYVMMLDDQQQVCDFYQNTVIDPQLTLKAFSDVRTFFKVLEHFIPDVFLLDYNMPDVSGVEVAKLIRQQSKFDYIPIVFITAEDNEDVKIEILNAGGDDVITKGTSVHIVMQHIRYRMLKGKQIRYLAFRDSLTGVLNHGQIMDALMQAFSLWQRKQQNFVVVMLDLDNFKTINDKYGHPAGDKVLFAISQLLNRSLRDSDLVGRYGGEEFMLLLHDTEVEAVIDKINDIRERFAELRFKAGIHNFSVTFSAGLANAADFTHSDALLEAADLALYAAKHDGKNCIHTHVETSVTSVHSH